MKTIYSNKENIKETLLNVIECLNRNELIEALKALTFNLNDYKQIAGYSDYEIKWKAEEDIEICEADIELVKEKLCIDDEVKR